MIFLNKKLPVYCESCPLWNDEIDECNEIGEVAWRLEKIKSEKRELVFPRPNNCPLIELPPHGDLIDRDMLEQEAQKRLLECKKHDNEFRKPYEIMNAIALAPTIIPSDKEETCTKN